MSFYINGVKDEWSYHLDARLLSEKVPRFARGYFDPLQDYRKALAEAAHVKMGSTAIGMSNSGRRQLIANTPISVWANVMNRRPEYFQTSKGLYEFVRKYPQYRVGRTIIR